MAIYDSIADWYDDSVRSGMLLHDLAVPALLKVVPSVQDQRVCDLGCGQGVVARELAHRKARVVGVDISRRLLEIAKKYKGSEGIEYVLDDAQTLASFGDATFDGVLCNLTLMDIPDLEATCQSVYRVLRLGGWFAFSITHPCFQTSRSRWVEVSNGTIAREVRAYFREGLWRSESLGGVRGQVGAYHRTLGTYFNALIAAGLGVAQVLEPQAAEAIAERMVGYSEVPAMLVVRANKKQAF